MRYNNYSLGGTIMKNNSVKIGDVLLKKNSKNEYEYTDEKEQLEYNFVIDAPDDIIVFVFDSLIPMDSENEGYLGALYANSLEEAVHDIAFITKENLHLSLMWDKFLT